MAQVVEAKVRQCDHRYGMAVRTGGGQVWMLPKLPRTRVFAIDKKWKKKADMWPW